MVKNLKVSTQDASISLKLIHKIIFAIKKEYNLDISFLSISFLNTKKLREVNKTYLKHDYDTDIITFNYSNRKQEIDAEILISFEMAKINAKKYKVTYEKELLRLVIHGMLHLLNFDDKNSSSKKVMKKEENKLINKFNFALFACE